MKYVHYDYQGNAIKTYEADFVNITVSGVISLWKREDQSKTRQAGIVMLQPGQAFEEGELKVALPR